MVLNKPLKWQKMLLCILIPLAVGALAGRLSREGMSLYQTMYKPLLSPSGWVFPVVWSLLYILMGIASCLVYCSDASLPRKKRALILYGLQLAVNFVWPLLFFRFGLQWLSFFWLLLLIGLVWACMTLFRYILPRAGKLMLPYLLWLFYAAYLNLGAALLN